MDFWQTTGSLCLSISALAIHVHPSCHSQDTHFPFLKGNNTKVLSSYHMWLKVHFLQVMLSLLHQVQIWISSNIQCRMVGHGQNHHNDSFKKGKDEKRSHWSIGNLLLDRNFEDFLPWHWRKSFGQILVVLLSGWDFLILCLFILLEVFPCPLSSMATSELGNAKQCCLAASRFKLPDLYQLVWDILLLQNLTVAYLK